MLHVKRRTDVSERLTLLVYELLDAHDDTARLAADLPLDWRWEVHLGYLRDLQRAGREGLAHASPAGRRGKTLGAVGAWRLRANVTRRGARRCARGGHGKGPT
jgi:hypothetical protein